LVGAEKHDVKQRWTQDDFPGNFLFLDHGSLVCYANSLGKGLPDEGLLGHTDWRKDRGEWKDRYRTWGSSAGGDLLTVTDSKYVALPWKSLLEFLDMGTEYVAPRRQLIWNVRTGKEIASWGVNRQDELVGGELKNARTIKTNFVVSLSPNGKYLAEGGGGSVAVYTVQP
jgi:hypothetical protein